MEKKSSEFNDNLTLFVKSVLPSDIQLIYLSQAGYKSKNIDIPSSNIEIRGVVLNTRENYLLQRPKKEFSIKTTYEGVGLIGLLLDITQALDESINSHFLPIEILRGIPIYEEFTGTRSFLKNMFVEGYNAQYAYKYYTGFFNTSLRELRSSEENQKGFYDIQLLTDTVYFVLVLRAIKAGKAAFDSYTIEEVINQAGKEEETFLGFIKKASEGQKAIPIDDEVIKLLEAEKRKCIDTVKINEDAVRDRRREKAKINKEKGEPKKSKKERDLEDKTELDFKRDELKLRGQDFFMNLLKISNRYVKSK